MDKIKRFFLNLPFRTSFILYVAIFVVIALSLMFTTASLCQKSISNIQAAYPNEEEWYYLATPDGEILEDKTRVWKTETIYSDKDEMKMSVLNAVIYLSIPFYSAVCLIVATMLFYRNKMSKPLAILQEAHQKISDNNLDFTIDYASKDEMGTLCISFEKMRVALLENSRQMWGQMEQRKRLNAAFAHDLRTPLTVLKGYSEILQQEGESQKTKATTVTMTKHIGRLERYVDSMSSLQKIEDIVPDYQNTDLSVLLQSIEQMTVFVCRNAEKHLEFHTSVKGKSAVLDSEIISVVAENLVANAVRYGKNEIHVDVAEKNNVITLTVTDDGNGFSPKSIRQATEPYYTEDADRTNHFGLGLYICKMLCKHHGGIIQIRNVECGAMVNATFKIQNE